MADDRQEILDNVNNEVEAIELGGEKKLQPDENQVTQESAEAAANNGDTGIEEVKDDEVEEDIDDITEEKEEVRRPKNTAFKQQRLPAWQPILTATTVLPTFFVLGFLFIPIGVGLLITSNNVKEFSVDYTRTCYKTEVNQTTVECSSVVANLSFTAAGGVCQCELEFNLTEAFSGQVYLYYGLSNYYQNHRRYVRSRDDVQLLGEDVGSSSSTSSCSPYEKRAENNETGEMVIAPCGAIANSLFNDTFTLYYRGDIASDGVYYNEPMLVNVTRTGIAWESDKSTKFKNPSPQDNLTAAFAPYSRPFNWQKDASELDPTDPSNNGYQNEDLMVWMRTAALPTFRKLFRLVDHTPDTVFDQGLPKGTYLLAVGYAYPVTAFDGTKRMVLSTTSWLGGKNPFLGIAYIVTGSLCIVFGVFFLLVHIKKGKRRAEITLN